MFTRNNKTKIPVSIFDICLFSMLGALMYASKVLMEAFPNIHLLGMFTVSFTLVFRKKALIPIYIYVFLDGLFSGFSVWWIPYLYIWTVLWGTVMLLPKNMPRKVALFVCPVICSLHGFAFGTLYAPAYALMFRMDLGQAIAWIVEGLSFDTVHGVGNLFAGLFIVPLTELLKKLLKIKKTSN